MTISSIAAVGVLVFWLSQQHLSVLSGMVFLEHVSVPHPYFDSTMQGVSIERSKANAVARGGEYFVPNQVFDLWPRTINPNSPANPLSIGGDCFTDVTLGYQPTQAQPRTTQTLCVGSDTSEEKDWCTCKTPPSAPEQSVWRSPMLDHLCPVENCPPGPLADNRGGYSDGSDIPVLCVATAFGCQWKATAVPPPKACDRVCSPGEDQLPAQSCSNDRGYTVDPDSLRLIETSGTEFAFDFASDCDAEQRITDPSYSFWGYRGPQESLSAADLSLTRSGPETIVVNETELLRYTLTATNIGPLAAGYVSLASYATNGVLGTVTDTSAKPVSCVIETSGQNSFISCKRFSLKAGESRTFTLDLPAGACVQQDSIDHYSFLTNYPSDPHTFNNVAWTPAGTSECPSL